MIQLFKALVWPRLESVWSPLYKKDILVIENVQRRATKLITELKDMPYGERLKSLNLPSLAYRRLREDLIETCKYTHNIYNIESKYLLPRRSEITRGHSWKLSKQRFDLDVRKRFCSNRVNRHWDSLPQETVNVPSINSFKNQIDYQDYQDIIFSTDLNMYPNIM